MAEQRAVNVLPERLQNHSMAKTRTYINYDEEQGLWVTPSGFLVEGRSGSYISPDYFNADIDPYIELESVTMEKEDFLLISPVKCGTHWMFEVMRMLSRGSSDYDPLPKEAQWLDIKPLKSIYEACPSPHVLVSHLPLSFWSHKFRRDDTKSVFMIRNIKDVIVSSYHHHIQKKSQPFDSRVEFDVHFRELMYSKYAPYGNHFDAIADCWDHHRSDPNILLVMFEDLKRETEETINRVANHMGVVYTPQLIKDISMAVQIEKMKPGKYESEALLRQKFGENFTLFRTGKIGEWKSWFTIEQNEEFHRKFDEWNKTRQIPMIFE